MSKTITRRRFLKDSLAATAGMALLCSLDFMPFSDIIRANDSIDTTSLSIVRDMSKCIGCGRCVEACSGMQGLDILTLTRKNGKTVSSLKYADTLGKSACIGCGQCARVCPSGAICIRDELAEVNAAIAAKRTVWQFAPSVQHIIGEEYRSFCGEDVSPKLAAAVHMLGGMAFRTDFGADITIMEEANEFLNRRKSGNTAPFLTSCCPGWINYMELNFPELIPNVSTCKSPMEMLGALIKHYLPQRLNIAAEDIYHIAVMPCTAKKHEARREQVKVNSVQSVDAVITVSEFKRLLDAHSINLSTLADDEFDTLFNNTSGGGRIFGSSGGVCEAAMRTAYYTITGEEPPRMKFAQLRGNENIKTLTVNAGGETIRACVVNGIANAEAIAQDIINGVCEYDFIEVMACPGGCAGGGGTPMLFGDAGLRHRGMYESDSKNVIHSPHNNTTLAQIYAEYLSYPCSHTAEGLLHTQFSNRRD